MSEKYATRMGVAVVLGIVAAVGGARLFAGAGQAAQPASAAARPALFTEAQATTGRTLYEKSCATCHGATLSGGSAPALMGATFQASWRDPRVTLDDLFFIIRTTMPPNASASLSAQEHAAVFAHILKANGYPSGSAALSATSVDLKLQHLQVTVPPPPPRPAPPQFIAGAAGAAPANGGPDQATLTAAGRSTEWLF